MLSSFFSDITDHGIKPSFSFLLSNSIDQTCSDTIQPQITWFPLKLSMMESQPRRGVAPVEVRTDVRYPCKANGSISCQSLYVITIFCTIFLIFLFAASTAPFIFGL